jgi:hypothetical protein
LARFSAHPRGKTLGMLDARQPKDKRDELLAETLWSLGLFVAVAGIVVLLSLLGPGR